MGGEFFNMDVQDKQDKFLWFCATVMAHNAVNYVKNFKKENVDLVCSSEATASSSFSATVVAANSLNPRQTQVAKRER